jgi:hypothetical protein
MGDLKNVHHNELEITHKAALFLRDKLLTIDRDGPLVKLLTREINLINDEMSRRRMEAQTAPGQSTQR